MTEETSGRDWLADADTAAALLRTARRLFVITGAGISADSGLPTYRGIGGLYDDTHTEDAIPIEQALSGSMLVRRPAITWKYLAQIERACRGARPNAGNISVSFAVNPGDPANPDYRLEVYRDCAGKAFDGALATQFIR